jgi:hypothetical protein
MTQHEDAIYTIARGILWACAALAVLFPLLYHWNSHGQWRHTPVGRYVMAFRVIFALLLLFTALAPYLPLLFTLYASMILYALSITILVAQIRFLFDPDSMDPKNVLEPHRLLDEDDPAER